MGNLNFKNISQILFCYFLFSQFAGQAQDQTQIEQSNQQSTIQWPENVSQNYNLNLKNQAAQIESQINNLQLQFSDLQKNQIDNDFRLNINSDSTKNYNSLKFENKQQTQNDQTLGNQLLDQQRQNQILQENNDLQIEVLNCKQRLYVFQQQQNDKNWKTNCQKIINVFQNELKKLQNENQIFQNQLQQNQVKNQSQCSSKDIDCLQQTIQQLQVQNQTLSNLKNNQTETSCNKYLYQNQSPSQMQFDKGILQIENENLKYEIKILKEKLQNFQNEQQGLQTKVNFVVIKPRQQDTKECSMQQIEILNLKNQDLQNRLQEKEKQIEELTIQSLSDLKTQNQNENSSFEKASLEMQIDALTSQLKTQQFLKLKTEDELFLCQNNNLILKQEYNNSQSKLLIASNKTEECYSKMKIQIASKDELQQQLKKQNEENTKLKRNIISCKLDSLQYKEAESHINKLKGDIKDQQKQQQICSNDLTKTKNNLQQKEKELQLQEQNLKDIQNQKDFKEQTQIQLQNQLFQCNKDLQQANSNLLEFEQLKNKQSLLEIKIENQNDRYQIQTQQLQDCQNQSENLKNQLLQMSQKNSQYEQEIQKIALQESQILELTNQLENLNQVNMDLRQNINDLNTIQTEQKNQLQEFDKTKKVNDDLNKQIEQQQQEIKNFQTNQNFQFQRFKTIDILIQRNKDLNDENERLNSLISKAQNQNDTIILLEQCENELSDIQEQFFQQNLDLINIQQELNDQQLCFKIQYFWNFILQIEMKEKEKLLQFANLPQKKNEDLISEEKLETIKQEKTKEQFEIIKQILNYLNIYYTVFSDPSKEYKFNLPPCYFDFDNHDEILHIDIPVFNEEIPRQNLSKEMLDQIEKDGTFEVESKKFELNYKWKMSDFLIKGKEVVLQQFRKTIGFAHQLLIRTQRLFSFGKAIYVMSEGRKYPINLWAALAQIPAFFLNLFSIIFGVPVHQTYAYNFRQLIINEILRERTKSLDPQEFQDIIYLAENLQTYDSQKVNHIEWEKHNIKVEKNKKELLKMHKDLEKLWQQYFEEEKNKLEDCEEEEYNQKINEILSKKQQFIIDNYDNLQSNLDSRLKNIFKQYLQVAVIIQKAQHEKNIRQSQLQTETVKAIKKENPYLCNVFFWFKHQKKVQFKLIKKQVEQEFQASIVKKLEDKNLTVFKKIYEQTSNIIQQRKKNIENLKLIRQHQRPKEYHIIEYLSPPYEVKKVEDVDQYILIKTRTITIKSDHFFWKLNYFFKRYIIHSKNATQIMIRFLKYGPFGIKQLFGVQSYYFDYSVDHKTGIVKNDVGKINPIWVKFQTTMKGVRDSRENFENSPDNAIFGKDVQRIFNYIECYLFRTFIVGTICVLIIHPIINMIMITVYFLLTISAFGYIFAYELIAMSFRIGILDVYQARIDTRIHLKFRQHYYEILLQNFRFFPLIHLTLNFIVLGIVQLLHIIFLAYFYPLVSLLTAIIGVLVFYLRTGYDKFMFNFIIKTKAMVPSRNTNLARKIAGPGVSQNLYYTLKIEDSIQLVMAQLEKLKLLHYQKLVNQYIEGDLNLLKENFNKIISPHFGTANINLTEQRNIIYKYQSKLQLEINERNSQLHFLNKNLSFCKIKFTDQDLKELKESTYQILQNNLKEYMIYDFVWNYYGVKEGHYKRLTCKILDSVFNGNKMIMQSIQDTEQRIVMRETKQSSNLLSKKQQMINRAIKGDVLLKHHKPHFLENKNTIKDLYIGTIDIQNLLNSMNHLQGQYQKVFININDRLQYQNSKN